jgi:hypothetical protein
MEVQGAEAEKQGLSSRRISLLKESFERCLDYGLKEPNPQVQLRCQFALNCILCLLYEV